MNKKHIYIATFIATGVITLGSFANALALVIKPVNDTAFGISQAKAYYLKGSFNDWAASNEYMLEDVTATMGPEENKISEFTITKALSKDDELKIWDSFNNWYEQGDNCSYRDKWERSTGNGDNYVVPMTATYSVYLKLYSTGASEVYLTASNPTTLYLKPNNNWKSDSARFAAYFFNDSEDINTWADMTISGDFYTVDVPNGNYINVIFCRMNPGNAENSWSNKWNQTGNLSLDYRCEFEVPEDENVWDVSNDATWRAR